MRIYALIVFCGMVSVLSGISLFWSVTNQRGEAWMHAVFLIASITGMLATLSLIRRTAGRSMSSTMSFERVKSRDGNDRRERG